MKLQKILDNNLEGITSKSCPFHKKQLFVPKLERYEYFKQFLSDLLQFCIYRYGKITEEEIAKSSNYVEEDDYFALQVLSHSAMYRIFYCNKLCVECFNRDLKLVIDFIEMMGGLVEDVYKIAGIDPKMLQDKFRYTNISVGLAGESKEELARLGKCYMGSLMAFVEFKNAMVKYSGDAVKEIYAFINDEVIQKMTAEQCLTFLKEHEEGLLEGFKTLFQTSMYEASGIEKNVNACSADLNMLGLMVKSKGISELLKNVSPEPEKVEHLRNWVAGTVLDRIGSLSFVDSVRDDIILQQLAEIGADVKTWCNPALQRSIKTTLGLLARTGVEVKHIFCEKKLELIQKFAIPVPMLIKFISGTLIEDKMGDFKPLPEPTSLANPNN